MIMLNLLPAVERAHLFAETNSVLSDLGYVRRSNYSYAGPMIWERDRHILRLASHASHDALIDALRAIGWDADRRNPEIKHPAGAVGHWSFEPSTAEYDTAVVTYWHVFPQE
jgi:hypothetical protein